MIGCLVSLLPQGKWNTEHGVMEVDIEWPHLKDLAYSTEGDRADQHHEFYLTSMPASPSSPSPLPLSPPVCSMWVCFPQSPSLLPPRTVLTVCVQYLVIVVTRMAPNNSMTVPVEVAIHHFSINISCSAALRSPSPSTVLPVSYFLFIIFLFPASFIVINSFVFTVFDSLHTSPAYWRKVAHHVVISPRFQESRWGASKS